MPMVMVMVAQVVGGESDIADMAAIRRGGAASSSRETPPVNASKTLVSQSCGKHYNNTAEKMKNEK